jgi:hypothetical protein
MAMQTMAMAPARLGRYAGKQKPKPGKGKPGGKSGKGKSRADVQPHVTVVLAPRGLINR